MEVNPNRRLPFRWCPTSVTSLEQSERRLLSYLQRPFVVDYVTVPSSNCEENYRIRTLKMNENVENRTPLVLLHGFASGIGLWVLNLDSLAENRPVYTLDLLGFGLSSRPRFSSRNEQEVEQQFVESIENWRQHVGLDKFILLGHSMGGYIAAAYALKYPDNISHLILADPWGFPTIDDSPASIRRPLWIKAARRMSQYFNPLSGLRAAGPLGPRLVDKFRPDILQKFLPIIENPEIVRNYIYHCNAQTPSGEVAFKALSMRFGWAKQPMIQRIGQLREDVPITFIYGLQSWIDYRTGIKIREMRKNSLVRVRGIRDAGHHVYADNAKMFNTFVNNVCSETDNSEK